MKTPNFLLTMGILLMIIGIVFGFLVYPHSVMLLSVPTFFVGIYGLILGLDLWRRDNDALERRDE